MYGHLRLVDGAFEDCSLIGVWRDRCCRRKAKQCSDCLVRSALARRSTDEMMRKGLQCSERSNPVPGHEQTKLSEPMWAVLRTASRPVAVLGAKTRPDIRPIEFLFCEHRQRFLLPSPGIHTRSRRLRRTTGRQAQKHTQIMRKCGEAARLEPAGRLLVDCRPGRQVIGHRAPRNADLDHVA